VWRRQDRIDKGLVPGLTSAENAERKRIADLETELRASRRALELLKETADQKGGSRRRK
jgi:transposase